MRNTLDRRAREQRENEQIVILGAVAVLLAMLVLGGILYTYSIDREQTAQVTSWSTAAVTHPAPDSNPRAR
jgi:hypothetical protein